MGLSLLIIVLLTRFFANRAQRILGVVEEIIYGICDDIIFLKKPLLVGYGVVKIVSRRVTRTSIGIPKGKGISIGLTEAFDLNSDFEGIRGPMLIDRIDLGFFRERGYLMVVDRDINGYIILPVVRILDRRHRGVCITYIDSSMNKVSMGKHIIHSESLYGDKVSILVHVDNRSISGEITFKKVSPFSTLVYTC